MKQYRIGNYAKYLGVTPDLLKHYEDMGIISSERSESGYRYYQFHTTVKLMESIRLRNYGLSLREIREILTAHEADNAQMERIFDERMELLRQENLLNEELITDYGQFLQWKESLNGRDWDWEIRRSRPMCFLPHTDGYEFLEDARIYEILNHWIGYIPIVKSAVKTCSDGGRNWGLLVEEEVAKRLKLPVNNVVEVLPSRRIFYYKFRAEILRTEQENAGNPEHPAFRVLRSLNLESEMPYFRVSLMPAEWNRTMGSVYGYYAIILKES